MPFLTERYDREGLEGSEGLANADLLAPDLQLLQDPLAINLSPLCADVVLH